MSGGGLLLVVAFATPLAMLAACLSADARARMPALLPLAALPALAAALLAPGASIALPHALLGLTFALDTPGAVLLGAVALLWVAGGIHAAALLRGDGNAGRFTGWWLLTLAGSIGVFMAADLVSFYLVFSMVSLAAYGLIAHDGTAGARRAGMIYVALAVLGEAFLLMGFVLLAAATPGNSLLIRDAVAALPASPWLGTSLLLVMLGFAVKIGLVPLHVWMPLSYPAAPIPAAAVLSGAAVKAGVIGLVRFLPLDVAMPGWGVALAVAGFVAAFFGVGIGLCQRNPRAVLAYSSISQMGVIATVFGMGLAAGDRAAALAASVYAAHHVLVKGGLFLAVGLALAGGARRLWPVLLPAAILALGLGGAPLTGGSLAKLVVKPQVGDGFVGMLSTLSAIGTTVLMLHFLARLVSTAASGATGGAHGAAPARLVAAWLAIALAAVAVPWGICLALGLGSLAGFLAPATLLEVTWPVLLGGVLAFGLRRVAERLPRIPESDIVVVLSGTGDTLRRWSDAWARADVLLRQWPVAGVALLALTVLLGLAMALGR